MKALVIPDVHLKPWIFDLAEKRLNKADIAVCLMDIADDWRKQYDIDLYKKTYGRAIRFAKDHPETVWCYGNHDLSYLWQQKETGYSPIAPLTVCNKLQELKDAIPSESQLGYVQLIDNVLFAHGGVTKRFVDIYCTVDARTNARKMVRDVNKMNAGQLWHDLSPIWFRPQYSKMELYRQEIVCQVVGHTPVPRIVKKNNCISTDTFSTDVYGRQIGPSAFVIIDTETGKYRTIHA